MRKNEKENRGAIARCDRPISRERSARYERYTAALEMRSARLFDWCNMTVVGVTDRAWLGPRSRLVARSSHFPCPPPILRGHPSFKAATFPTPRPPCPKISRGWRQIPSRVHAPSKHFLLPAGATSSPHFQSCPGYFTASRASDLASSQHNPSSSGDC